MRDNLYRSASFLNAVRVRTNDTDNSWIRKQVPIYDSILEDYFISLQPVIKIVDKINEFTENLQRNGVGLGDIKIHHLNYARHQNPNDNMLLEALRMLGQNRWWAETFKKNVLNQLNDVFKIENEIDRLYANLMFIEYNSFDLNIHIDAYEKVFKSVKFSRLPEVSSVLQKFENILFNKLKHYTDPYNVLAYYNNNELMSARSLSVMNTNWIGYQYKSLKISKPKASEVFSKPKNFKPLVKDDRYTWFVTDDVDVAEYFKSDMNEDVEKYYSPEGEGAQRASDHFKNLLN
jgi:hypothetical protein